MAIDTTKTITKVTYEGVDIPLAGTSGGDSGGKYLVQVIDYDGTVLKSDHLDTGATFTLPDVPTNHSKLVFQEWSSPVTITDNSITVGNSDITIGATYKTASGLTEIDIELTKATGLEVVCNMVGNKNWGDGTTDSAKTHTYTNYGSYTITCDGTSCPQYIFGQEMYTDSFYCKKIRLGELVKSLSSNAFRNCVSLTSIAIPNSVNSFGSYVFSNCGLLTSITIPSSIGSIEAHMFETCKHLTSIAIPNSVYRIISFAFSSCYSLTSITIPSSVNGSYQNLVASCYSLTSITIPNKFSSIADYMFQYCDSLIEYDFTTYNSVPTLRNTNAFNGINKLCKIYVPDALYDDWVVATNWATYADYIYKASEMEG